MEQTKYYSNNKIEGWIEKDLWGETVYLNPNCFNERIIEFMENLSTIMLNKIDEEKMQNE